MKSTSTKVLCLKGLLIALVAISTMVINIPVAATSGYIHLGDSMILIASIFFGWEYGFIAGGVGSMLADVLSGYAHWAPFTLIIKGIMGFIIGKIAKYEPEKGNILAPINIIATVVGVAWMVFGYFIGGAILKGSFLVSLTSVPSNIVQGVGGIVIYLVLAVALNKAKIYKLL
ncbi:MAG: ECF transporter S component [Anaerotignaceae bacterium]